MPYEFQSQKTIITRTMHGICECSTRQLVPRVLAPWSLLGTDVLCVATHGTFPEAFHGGKPPCNRRLGKQSLIKRGVVGDDPTPGEVLPDGVVNLIVSRCRGKALNREPVDRGRTRMDFTGWSHRCVQQNPSRWIQDCDLQDLISTSEARCLSIDNHPIASD